jgi:hypothetical protein
MKYTLVPCLLLIASSGFSQPLSQGPEVVAFIDQVCGVVDTTGSISRSQIEGSLEGNVQGIAKTLGASLGADGKIVKTDETWTNIPLDALPDLIKSSQECRERLSALFVQTGSQPTQVPPSLTGTASVSGSQGVAIGVNQGPVEVNQHTSEPKP